MAPASTSPMSSGFNPRSLRRGGTKGDWAPNAPYRRAYAARKNQRVRISGDYAPDARKAWLQLFQHVEPLAPEHHVLGELSKPSEIPPVRFPPRSEAAIIFSLVVSEGCVTSLNRRCVSPIVSITASARPSPLSTIQRLPTSVLRPPTAAQHVAVFVPTSTRLASSSASAGLSPKLKLSVGCRMALITNWGPAMIKYPGCGD